MQLDWIVEYGHSPDFVVDRGFYDHEYAFKMFDWFQSKGWAYVSVRKAS